jgi:hypothetical protein
MPAASRAERRGTHSEAVRRVLAFAKLESREGKTMRLTPPTKNFFYISVILGALALLLYFTAILGMIDGGFITIGHYVFWLVVVGWLVLLASVIWEGV